MKNNKLICIVLALLVCLTIAVSASATTGNNNLTIKLESNLGSSAGPATTVNPGEEFTVSVKLENNPGVKFYVGYVSFNADNLELAKIESKNDNVVVNKSPDEDGKLAVVIGNVNALIGGDCPTITDSGVVVAVLTFKVKATTEITEGNDIVMEVGKDNVVDANGNIGADADVEISEVEAIKPNVIPTTHVCKEDSMIVYGYIAATCDEAGFEGDIVCSVCNKKHSEGKVIPALGHDLDQENFEIKTEPTCDTDGVKVLRCKREGCDHTEEASIAKHDHDYQTVKGYAATCTTAGLTDGEQCSICKAWKTAQEVIPAAGHKYVHQYYVVEPGCETAGTEWVKCDTCAHETMQAAAAKGHTSVDVAKKDATCAEAGHEAGKVCSVCDKTLEGLTEIPATGKHTWNDGEITKAATCKEAGVKTYTCTVCGETKTETIEKIAEHTWNAGEVTKAATCKEAGVKTYTCTVCGETKTESIEKIAEHTWGAGSITTLPTCGAMGVRTYTCTVCGETKVDDKVPATGNHTYGDWKVTTEATTEAEGVKTRECAVCGAKENAPIEKLPEPENNTVVIVVVVAVVVLAGAGVAAYFVLKNKKKF